MSSTDFRPTKHLQLDFKKGRKYELPEMYNGIVNKDEYNLIMDASIQYHKDNRLEISKIDQGETVTELNGEEQHRYLDMLAFLRKSNRQNPDKTIQNIIRLYVY